MRTFFRTSFSARFASAGAIAGLFVCSPLAEARQPFEVWKDCRLDDDESNDGDSFHVKAGGGKYIIRLYLVDAPETDAGFPERVAEQAAYFRITPAQSVELGELSKKFVEEKLSQPFSVRTSKQNAMGRSNKQRYYGFAETSEGDLGELLVGHGLARVHGVAPAADDSIVPKSEKQKLRRLELEARKLKVGGWGAAVGRMKARPLAPGAKSKLDSFDAFFHPERAVVAQPRTLPEPTPAPTTPVIADRAPDVTAAAESSAGGLLDPNTATVAELVKLKGIGPVLAGRIIEARPFKSADELRRVKGIGPKKYEKIRPHFTPAL